MIPSILPVYQHTSFAIGRAEGPYVWTDDGRKLLDFTAGIAVNCLGHCHPALVKALTDQANKVWHVSNYYRIPLQEELADKLTSKTFADTIFFTNSGTESVELAIKMARRFFWASGVPEKNRIITFDGSFHGRTYGSISAAGKKILTEGFEPLLPGFDHVPFGDNDALEAAIGPQTAAILVEPIQGEGGIRVIPDKCLKGLRELCDRHGLLLIFDEIQCGVGRTGKGFAYEWAGITPDIMTVAKGIGGGFPLGGCMATEAAAKPMTLGTHGTTYGGNPLAMAVGNAVIDNVFQDDFLQNVQRTGQYLREKLEQLALAHPHILKEVRGKGLMLGLQVKGDPADFVHQLEDNGMLAAKAAENVVRLLPPLIITQAHADEALGIIETVCNKHGA